jgi:hypothetical protein
MTISWRMTPVAREEYLAKSREENRTNTIQQTGVNLLSSFMKIEIVRRSGN